MIAAFFCYCNNRQLWYNNIVCCLWLLPLRKTAFLLCDFYSLFGVYMKNNNSFNKNDNSKSFKYFILAFSLFVVILGVCSVFLFLNSIDFNFENIIKTTSPETTAFEIENEQTEYSVKGLKGKSCLLFVCLNEDSSYSFSCTVETDYEKREMLISSYDLKNVYDDGGVDGAKEKLFSQSVSVDKYVIFDYGELNDFLSEFDAFEVNVKNNIDYKSSDFNLNLKAGTQSISADYLVKYLQIADADEKNNLVCSVINTVLKPKNTEKSDKLFKIFVNLFETDISIIDYSNGIDNIKIYSNSDDKFLPAVK